MIFDIIRIRELAGLVKLNEQSLPMDVESRMKRAKELGFVYRAYHGTRSEINAFDLSKSGSSNPTKKGFLEPKAIWAAENPSVGVFFSGGDPLGLPRRNEDGGITIPLLVRFDNPYTAIMKDEAKRYYSDTYITHREHGIMFDINPVKEAVVGLAMDKGHDGVIFKGGYDGWVANGDVYAIFNPKNIRSIYARFDPDHIEDTDLMA